MNEEDLGLPPASLILLFNLKLCAQRLAAGAVFDCEPGML